MVTLRDAVASLGLFWSVALCGCQGSGSSAAVASFSAPPTSTPSTPSPPASLPTTSPTPPAPPSPNAGGVVNIGVPTPSPVLCSPSPLIVSVGAIGIATCSTASYAGPIAFDVLDPTVASVALAPQFISTYFVTGVAAGSTSLALAYAPGGGSGSLTIVVTP